MIRRIFAWTAAGARVLGRGLLSDWQYRLRVLFTLIILLQFVLWFNAYWLSATTWLAAAALAITFIVECFPRVPQLLRHALALILIAGAHFYRLGIRFAFDFEGIDGRWERFWAAAAAVGEGLAQMSPYIWFALGAWVTATLTVMWLTTRVRIIAFVVLSVFIFAVVDSYSLHIFWDQVALIVFSGLGLIILDHLDRFRRKYPESWSYLKDYPMKLAGTIVIIVSLVMAAGIAAPNAPPLLTDPYTLYMEWKGKQVVTAGKGFASAVIPEDMFNAASGYGRDDSNLGGGFDYDYSEVMRVETTHRTYYRGETKSLYTGSGWEASEADLEASAVPVALQEALPAFDWNTTGEVPKAKVEQTFYVSQDRSFPVLFGAHPISSLVLLGGETEAGKEAEGAAWSPRQGELRWNEEQPYPTVYSVISEVPVFDETMISGQQYDFSGELWEPYLQLPDSLPGRVRELAFEVAGEGTPFERVKRIEQYLQTNFEYNNKPDLSLGRSPDFVDRFLFEIRSGYCDYFSTAMAVMVRSIGLPARWVKGYASGALDIEEFTGIPIEIIEQMEGGNYIVRNADAHSWVEVFFPEVGWVPFEPTAGFVLPEVMLDEQELAAIASSDAALAESVDSGVDAGRILSDWLPALLVLLMIAAIVAVLIPAAGFLRFRPLRRLSPMRSGASARQQALAEAGRIVRMLRRRGYTRQDHETARETFARWADKNGALKPDLDEVLEVLEKAKYSARDVTVEDVERLARLRRRMKQAL